MKKLKIKVFSIIFSLLTIFTLIIFIGSITRDYMERRNSISDVLNVIFLIFLKYSWKFIVFITLVLKYLWFSISVVESW